METTITKGDKEESWQLRHKVMWPDKTLDYIKLEDDDFSLFINNQEGQFRTFAILQQEQGKGHTR